MRVPLQDVRCSKGSGYSEGLPATRYEGLPCGGPSREGGCPVPLPRKTESSTCKETCSLQLEKKKKDVEIYNNINPYSKITIEEKEEGMSELDAVKS